VEGVGSLGGLGFPSFPPSVPIAAGGQWVRAAVSGCQSAGERPRRSSALTTSCFPNGVVACTVAALDVAWRRSRRRWSTRGSLGGRVGSTAPPPTPSQIWQQW
jgi:hypothetical protein